MKDMPTRGKAYEWACCGRTGLFHRDLVNEEEARGPAAGMPGGFGSVGEGIYLYVACSGLREGDGVVRDAVRVVRCRDRYGYFPCLGVGCAILGRAYSHLQRREDVIALVDKCTECDTAVRDAASHVHCH